MRGALPWPPKIRLYHVVAAIVVVSAVLIGVLVASHLPGPSGPALRVQGGDSVDLDYIGLLSSGKVFDTSVRAVAEDDANYPKALSFERRDSYNPFTVQIGAIPPAVIPGFEEGILGMRVGETRLIEVPPDKGYGPSDPGMLEVRPLVEEMPQFETMDNDEFEAQFEGDPALGLTVVEPFWGWDVIVTSVSTNFATIMHVPEEGMLVRPYGAWEARVESVDTSANGGQGLIRVRHLLDVSQIDNVGAEDEGGTFRVVAVAQGAGTYTVDYNREVVGQTLFFEVTVLQITRG